jgi:phosphonate transport system ATP-binding protein
MKPIESHFSDSRSVAIACRSLTTHHVQALERPILKDINLTIQSGEFVGLLGLNGAGKSTLLRSLMGLVPIAHGEIQINGINITNKTKTQSHQNTVMLFQGGALIRQLSALDNVLCGTLGARSTWQTLWGFNRSDRRRAIDLLDQLGLATQADQRTSTLSGGQQQRVAIARALMQSPSLLLVDEPTTGLDIMAARQVMEIFQKLQHQGITIVAILHDLEQVTTYCNRAIILQQGTIKYDGNCLNLETQFK